MEEQKLATALMGVMLVEGIPDAYSRDEADKAWDDALRILKGKLPDEHYRMVRDAVEVRKEERDEEIRFALGEQEKMRLAEVATTRPRKARER